MANEGFYEAVWWLGGKHFNSLGYWRCQGLFLVKFLIYLLIRERERVVHVREWDEREGERERIPGRLVLSGEPDARLRFTTLRSSPELKSRVSCLTQGSWGYQCLL